MELALRLKETIRDIPDFPKKGIIFKDITPVLKDPELFGSVVNAFYQAAADLSPAAVAAIESRGFIFGAPLARQLRIPLIPLRKPGKLPYKTISQAYQLEYGTDSIEAHEDALRPFDRVVLVDDLLATGGTMEAAVELVKRLGGSVVAVLFVIELSFLKGRERLKGLNITSLVSF